MSEVAFTVAAAALAGAMQSIAHAVAKQDTIPILTHAHIEAKDGQLEIRGTDLDISLRVSVPATVESGGAFAIPGALFRQAAANAPSDATVKVALSGDLATVSFGRTRYKLSTLPATDYPRLAHRNGTEPATFVLPSAELCSAIARIGSIPEQTIARPYCGGIYFHSADERIALVAMDGDRGHLARIAIAVPPEAMAAPAVIVPARAAGLIARLFGKADDLRVTISESLVEVEPVEGGPTLWTKLIDASFPDYQRVVPRDNPARLRMKSSILCTALRRIMLLDEAGASSTIKFTVTEDVVQIRTRTTQLGEAEDAVEVVEATGFASLPFEIALNGRYVLDALETLDTDEIGIELSDAGSPVLFRKPGADDAYVIVMPKRF